MYGIGLLTHIVLEVQVIPGQGQAVPQAGTRVLCWASTNQYLQLTMNTSSLCFTFCKYVHLNTRKYYSAFAANSDYSKFE